MAEAAARGRRTARSRATPAMTTTMTTGPEALGCGDTVEVGGTPLRRLTRTEYNNTIRDLLGDDTDPADAFPPDDTALGFEASGHVSQLVAQHYLDAAIAIAERAVGDLDALLPCDPTGRRRGLRPCLDRRLRPPGLSSPVD